MQTSNDIKNICTALVAFHKEVGKIGKDAKNPFFKSNRFYVYEHRRNDTGHPFYVGKGTGLRASQTSNRNEYWNNIVKKHGFTPVIVKDGLDESEAYAVEIGLILINKANGFCEANITIGGDGVVVGRRWWGGNISKSLTGIVRPTGEESTSYKSFSSKEELEHLYLNENLPSSELAKRFNVSTPTVISRLKALGIPVKRCGKANVRITCINDGRCFDTLAEAATTYGVYRENIRKVLRGKYKQTGGLIFKNL